jgi:hypothetical protein
VHDRFELLSFVSSLLLGNPKIPERVNKEKKHHWTLRRPFELIHTIIYVLSMHFDIVPNHRIGLEVCLISKILYEFLVSVLRATCTAHVIGVGVFVLMYVY